MTEKGSVWMDALWVPCEVCHTRQAPVGVADTPIAVVCERCWSALIPGPEETMAAQLLMQWFFQRYVPAAGGPYTCAEVLTERWLGPMTHVFVLRVAETICRSAQCREWQQRSDDNHEEGGPDAPC
jgi:hypothetical protein